jgi:hypothetical protein
MAININAKHILIILLSLYFLFYVKFTNSALIIPNIHYSVPTIPFDTSGCIYNGQSWTNPNGQVWDGYKWK